MMRMSTVSGQKCLSMDKVGESKEVGIEALDTKNLHRVLIARILQAIAAVCSVWQIYWNFFKGLALWVYFGAKSPCFLPDTGDDNVKL